MEGFRPLGMPIKDLEPVILLYEEYESLRLSDYEGFTQEQSATQMNVSRPTFCMILSGNKSYRKNKNQDKISRSYERR